VFYITELRQTILYLAIYLLQAWLNNRDETTMFEHRPFLDYSIFVDQF